MFISFSDAEEVTTYVTISWEESEDGNLKHYPTNINQKALGSEAKSVNETRPEIWETFENGVVHLQWKGERGEIPF